MLITAASRKRGYCGEDYDYCGEDTPPISQVHKQLTTAAIQQMKAARLDRETRVRVYSPNGGQIGCADVGVGDNRLTFPRCFLVSDALSKIWVRFATEDERNQEEKNAPAGHQTHASSWWRISELQPRSLIHCGKDSETHIAFPTDMMGLLGDRMQAVEQTATLHFTEKPCAEDDDIPTPPHCR